MPAKSGRRTGARLALALLALVVVAAIIGVVVGSKPKNPAPLLATNGRLAPHFEVPDLANGQLSISLESVRNRPLVLNFWASWCVPCRKELPAFQAAHRHFGGEIEFLGMNHQDSRDDALKLLRETGVTYRSGFDPQGRVARDYGVYGMPTTVFISSTGQILATHTGEMTEQQLSDTVTQLFKVRVADPG